MKKWITHNLGLKIIALALAIITWIYVNGELLSKFAVTKRNVAPHFSSNTDPTPK